MLVLQCHVCVPRIVYSELVVVQVLVKSVAGLLST